MTLRTIVGLAALLVLGACADSEAPPRPTDAAAPADRAVGMLEAGAGAGSAQPRLRPTPDGGAVLSWLEPDGDGHVLRYASWDGTGWGPARTADRGDDWFVNWADTPGVVALSDGRLLAHALVRQPAGGHAYDVRARLSDGTSWSEPVTPHTDGAAAEHGFVSAVPMGDRAGLVWLDGREQVGSGHHGGDMTLRYATLGAGGDLQDEAVLDARTCDCCPTAAVRTDRGLVVAYRDRSAGEVRDISVVRLVDGAWTAPQRVHADGWEINACPVNGPALAAHGDRVALAWYTGADSARVALALSDDGGATFGAPITIDARAPVGRVAVAMRPSGETVVGWLALDDSRAVFRTRSLAPDGALGEPLDVADIPNGRETGVPQLVAAGDRVLAAWTDPEAGRVRTASVTP